MAIFAYIAGALILYTFIWLLYRPLKFLFKLLCHSMIGVIWLTVGNFVLSWIGIGVGINLATALVAGMLGLPGTALLYTLALVM